MSKLLKYSIADCFLGKVLMAGIDNHIDALFLGNTEEDVVLELSNKFINYDLVKTSIDLTKLIKYIEDPIGNLEVFDQFSLEPFNFGTDFQQNVWRALRKIPIGTTISYATLAKNIGIPTAVRAVASACAKNNISILVPCHRVLRSDGELSGYRWGIERKKALLKKEGLWYYDSIYR